MVWSLKLSLESSSAWRNKKFSSLSVSSSAWRNKKFSSASKVVRLMFAQRFITIFNCRYHTSNHLSVCHKHTSLSPINCQSVDNCCIIINNHFLILIYELLFNHILFQKIENTKYLYETICEMNRMIFFLKILNCMNEHVSDTDSGEHLIYFD